MTDIAKSEVTSCKVQVKNFVWEVGDESEARKGLWMKGGQMKFKLTLVYAS